MTKILINRATVEQALEALEAMQSYAAAERKGLRICDEAIPALRAALAQQAEPVEPVTYIHRQGNHWEVSERHLDEDEKARGWTEEPLYTAPPQREPLTAPQIHELDWPNDVAFEEILEFVRAIERAHDIGGKE